MKRTGITIHDIAEFNNLCDAAVKAARGKRMRPAVKNFFKNFDQNITSLRRDILNGNAPYGIFSKFLIYDPKKRVIHAACFEDRVFHHAIMNLAGPVLERAMIFTTYACRPGKGTIAAVKRVQHNARRYPWYVKIDIDGYFDSIDQGILFQVLARRFKGKEFLELIKRIVGSYESDPGKGLPIGSLTSQYFANYYLDGLDRYIMEELKACAHVRYMDDIVWWCRSSDEAKVTLGLVKEYTEKMLLLEIKKTIQINRSAKGITYCGFRVFPGALKPGRRRRKRYETRRKFWESMYLSGAIDEEKLQAAYASVHALTAHTDSLGWRKENLRIFPPVEI